MLVEFEADIRKDAEFRVVHILFPGRAIFSGLHDSKKCLIFGVALFFGLDRFLHATGSRRFLLFETPGPLHKSRRHIGSPGISSACVLKVQFVAPPSGGKAQIPPQGGTTNDFQPTSMDHSNTLLIELRFAIIAGRLASCRSRELRQRLTLMHFFPLGCGTWFTAHVDRGILSRGILKWNLKCLIIEPNRLRLPTMQMVKTMPKKQKIARLSPDELKKLADRFVEATDPKEKRRLRAALTRGFYGTPGHA